MAAAKPARTAWPLPRGSEQFSPVLAKKKSLTRAKAQRAIRKTLKPVDKTARPAVDQRTHAYFAGATFLISLIALPVELNHM